MTEAASLPARERILRAAADLLAEGGGEAVSTRAVSARAKVQAPTLYRLFGDKQGMLDALVSYGFDRYQAERDAGHEALEADGAHPVDVLRQCWDRHVEFGVRQPALYALMYGTGPEPAARKEAYQQLRALMDQVAAAGCLRVPTEIAARMVELAGTGVTLKLIADPDDPTNAELSARTRDAILAAITVEGAGPTARAGRNGPSGHDGLVARALALEALLKDDPEVLSESEAALLREWLRRLATA